jgi:branched-subunit amino acid transport protein
VSVPVAVILGCAVTTFVIKAAGPVALGGRELPDVVQRALALLAPALLSALVAVSIFAHDAEWGVGADTAGVAAGGLLFWRTESVVGCVLCAAGVTALLRAV